MTIFMPCSDTQTLYRLLLDAVSRPGRRMSMPPADTPESTERLLLLETTACLIDHEVSYALTGPWPEPLRYEISLRTGAREVPCDTADFILVAGSHSEGAVLQAKRGTLSYPDLGATLVYCLDAQTAKPMPNDTAATVHLSGPGIKTPLTPEIAGLADEEYRLLSEINSEYPLGVDTFIMEGNRHVMAVPRSTHIEVD